MLKLTFCVTGPSAVRSNFIFLATGVRGVRGGWEIDITDDFPGLAVVSQVLEVAELGPFKARRQSCEFGWVIQQSEEYFCSLSWFGSLVVLSVHFLPF